MEMKLYQIKARYTEPDHNVYTALSAYILSKSVTCAADKAESLLPENAHIHAMNIEHLASDELAFADDVVTSGGWVRVYEPKEDADGPDVVDTGRDSPETGDVQGETSPPD